jgi:hypothetical protein
MTNERERYECLRLAEWYAACPPMAKKRLLADWSMWCHLFIWAGMFGD